jgi:hypothetical protein
MSVILSLEAPHYQQNLYRNDKYHRTVRVGFVVGKVALGQVSLRVFRFSPVYNTSVALHAHISSGE